MSWLAHIWPEWHEEELIGQGSYGKVYRIRREEMGHTFHAALKVIEIPQDEAEVKNLLHMGMDHFSIRSYFESTARSIINEIGIMETLKSGTNIVSIEDYKLVNREDGIGWTIYIRMELLESLSDYMNRIGTIPVEEAVRIGIDMCAALECCEMSGIIHRDVKPQNIFRTQYGNYKLGDFGIAKQLREMSASYSQKGTAMYMAPEVSRGEEYDSTVDIYSLGIMLYQFVNHHRMPFLPPYPQLITLENMEEAQMRRLRGDAVPVPAGVDPVLAQIICRACEPYKGNRYQKASDLKNALMAWAAGKIMPYTGAGGSSVPGGGGIPGGGSAAGSGPAVSYPGRRTGGLKGSLGGGASVPGGAAAPAGGAASTGGLKIKGFGKPAASAPLPSAVPPAPGSAPAGPGRPPAAGGTSGGGLKFSGGLKISGKKGTDPEKTM